MTQLLGELKCLKFQDLWTAAVALHRHYWYEPQRYKRCLKREYSDKCLHEAFKSGDQKNLNAMLDLYQLSRNFQIGKPNNNPKPGVLWKKVGSCVKNWNAHTSLLEKAYGLHAVASDISQNNTNHKVGNGPLTAASKLAWFLKPEDWTLFDSRANNAIGSHSFMHFYALTERLDFKPWCEATRTILQKSEHSSGLFAERIWDKFLYLCDGGPQRVTDKTILILLEDRKIAQCISKAHETKQLHDYFSLRLPLDPQMETLA